MTTTKQVLYKVDSEVTSVLEIPDASFKWQTWLSLCSVHVNLFSAMLITILSLTAKAVTLCRLFVIARYNW